MEKLALNYNFRSYHNDHDTIITQQIYYAI